MARINYRKKLREYKKSESKRPIKTKVTGRKQLELRFSTTRYPRA